MVNAIHHVGIVPDGTRRWSREHNITLKEGYNLAFNKLCSLIALFYEYGVDSVSIYLASSNNLLKRNHDDLAALDSALHHFFEEKLPNCLKKWHPQVFHIGSTKHISEFSFSEPLRRVVKESGFGHKKLYLLAGYDPFEEIQAAIGLSYGNNHESHILSRLWVPEYLDIVLRTGNANTISGFLPLQSSAARVYFLDELFNDLTTQRVLSIFEEFKNLHLKFGE